MNHSPRFWRLVERRLPGCRARQGLARRARHRPAPLRHAGEPRSRLRADCRAMRDRRHARGSPCYDRSMLRPGSLRADAAARHADRARAAVGRHVSGVAAVDRPRCSARRRRRCSSRSRSIWSASPSRRSSTARCRTATAAGRCCLPRSASICVATLACALAFSIETLIAARFVQAVGGSGASVLARAVVRDMYEGTRVGRELSRMAAIMALAPLVAPLIGGVLQTAFGWRSNFVALFCFGARGLVMVWLLLPETLRQRAPEPVSLALDRCGPIAASSRDRGFVIHLGIATCCLCGLFAWISSARLRAAGHLRPVAAGVRHCVRASARRAIMVGHVDRGALRDALGQRAHDGLRRRRDGARRIGDGAAARASTLARRMGRDRGDRPLHDRHGHDACRRRRPARCCRFPTAPARRRRCSASSRRPRPRWSARSSAIRSARRAWPLAIAMR